MCFNARSTTVLLYSHDSIRVSKLSAHELRFTGQSNHGLPTCNYKRLDSMAEIDVEMSSGVER
jgi:hypothetical protein